MFFEFFGQARPGVGTGHEVRYEATSTAHGDLFSQVPNPRVNPGPLRRDLVRYLERDLGFGQAGTPMASACLRVLAWDPAGRNVFFQHCWIAVPGQGGG
jgi:hypothetical protein